VQYPHYNPASDNRPLSDEELDQLDEMLAALPTDGAMNIEGLDGYLAGLLLSPVPLQSLPGETWLPPIWGGDEPHPFVSGKQCKKLVMLVLRHLQSIAVHWRDSPKAWEPIFSMAELDGEELADAEDWAVGFLMAVDLAPEAWAPCFDDPLLAPLLEPIVQLGGAEAPDLGVEALDGLSRALPEAVLALASRR
jgi:uncharacterized protein